MISDELSQVDAARGRRRPKDRLPFDTTLAHQPRMYDYWLGGKDNFEADRKAADWVTALYPDTVYTARANRDFLGRAVRFLVAQAGIRQFLDIGTGIPSAGNTHQVAQEVAPECRVVYVDYDPVVLAYARALLTSTPEGAIACLEADLRDSETILAGTARVLDFSQPVAVMMLMILHAIGGGDDAHGIVSRVLAGLPSGSYLAISHMASDVEPDRMAEMRGRVNRLSHQQYTFRSRPEVTRFFNGLDLVEPGVVQVQQWRPGNGKKRTTATWCGVARKP